MAHRAVVRWTPAAKGSPSSPPLRVTTETVDFLSTPEHDDIHAENIVPSHARGPHWASAATAEMPVASAAHASAAHANASDEDRAAARNPNTAASLPGVRDNNTSAREDSVPVHVTPALLQRVLGEDTPLHTATQLTIDGRRLPRGRITVRLQRIHSTLLLYVGTLCDVRFVRL